MKRAWVDWPDDPVRQRFEPGDRVKFRRRRGTVLQAWWSGGSQTFSEPRELRLRVKFDDCKVLEFRGERAEEVKPA